MTEHDATTAPTNGEASAPQGDDHDAPITDEPTEDAGRREELELLRERHTRLRADFENYRKRFDREVQRAADGARDAIVGDWVQSLDALDRAIASVEPTNPMAAGLRAIEEQMEAALARHGAERFGDAGDPFDPRLHEAVSVQARGDVAPGSVAEVHRPGYRIGERVLRPAQVVVAQGQGAA